LSDLQASLQFLDGSLTLVFRLTQRRFIGGYALGEHGMLFRGELFDHGNECQGRTTARQLIDIFAEPGAEEEATVV